MKDYKNFIVSCSEVLRGKPVIKGTRLTVELILKKLSEGATIPQLLDIYPSVKQEDIMAALAYASDVISHEAIIALN